MAENKLNTIVEEMTKLGDTLIPFTFPKVDFKTEKDVLALKQRTVLIDGYEMLLCFSKAEYDDHFLESIQLQSTCSPFLPFFLVCKIGRAFLGTLNIGYVEFLKENKKVYCWTVKTRDGLPLTPGKKNNKPGNFEGFKYTILPPGTIDLY